MNRRFVLGRAESTAAASYGFLPANTDLPVYADPPAQASDNVSPVTASQDPTTKLIQVGARSSGLPTGTDYVDSLITTAYDLTARPFLRRRLVFNDWATTRVTNQSHRGAVVQLNLVDDLDDAVATATLVEDYDALPTPLHSFKTNIILNEYGRVVTKTALFRGTSMIPFDPVAAERVGRNAGATIDKLAFSVLTTAGGITNAGAANGSIPTAVTVSGQPSNTLRAAYQSFQDNNVEPFEDGLYRAAMTPANATALRKEADAAGWRYWMINQEPDGGAGSIRRAQIIEYEGFSITVTTGVTGGFGCVMAGQDALAKASSIAPGFGDVPQVVIAPVVDRLRRFAGLGWYWLGGYARFRAEAVVTGDLAA